MKNYLLITALMVGLSAAITTNAQERMEGHKARKMEKNWDKKQQREERKAEKRKEKAERKRDAKKR